MSTPVVLGIHNEPDARVWSCVPCGAIYGNEHDPFRRCGSCGETCYTLTSAAAAIARRTRLENQRKGAA
jgi:hypothetical protein